MTTRTPFSAAQTVPGGTSGPAGALTLDAMQNGDFLPPLSGTPALACALDYARDHLAERIPLQTLADLTGLSLWRFSIVFRQQMGVPPHRYISQLRIARACELLRDGVSAASVADACGFYDQSHFSRHFKQQCGVTPGQFAATCQVPCDGSARPASSPRSPVPQPA